MGEMGKKILIGIIALIDIVGVTYFAHTLSFTANAIHLDQDNIIGNTFASKELDRLITFQDEEVLTYYYKDNLKSETLLMHYKFKEGAISATAKLLDETTYTIDATLITEKTIVLNTGLSVLTLQS